MIRKAYEKVTKEEVEKNISSHAICNHLDITYEDIKSRFLSGLLKTEDGYTYDNTRPPYISWWKNKKIMLSYVTAALNSERNKKEINDWLINWSKEDGKTYTLTCLTNVEVGECVYRHGDWKVSVPVTMFKVVVAIESSGNIENAGFIIKTAYPYPTKGQETILQSNHK